MTRADRTADVTRLQSSPLADDVEHRLRVRILSGDIPSGTRLLQIQLAEELGVSRSPLREALWALERDGLVRISNGNKTVEVVDLEIDHIIELYEVRETIDATAARLFAQQPSPGAAADALVVALADMEAVTKRKKPDLTRYADALCAFHLVLLEGCGNPQLSMFLPVVRLTTQVQTYRFVQWAEQHSPAGRSAAEITEMLNVGISQSRSIHAAVVAGDAAAAEAAARAHIRNTVAAVAAIRDRVRAESAASA